MSAGPSWAALGPGWPNRAHSRFVESGRIKWHVQVMGSGPPLLLIHGTGAATHSWRALAPLLAERFTVIAPDLPGHGFTRGRPVGGLSMRAMARAVAELIATLEVKPAVIVGHSAGAAIAVRMVLDGGAAPAAIVGIGAALLPFPGLAAKLFPTMAKLLFVNPLAPHFFARLARTAGETARFLERNMGSRIDAAGIAHYEALFSTPGHISGALTMMADWDLDALARDLPRLATRLLLIHGDRDGAIPVSSASKAATMVGDGRLIELPGAGHLVHEERPDEVAAMIRKFAGAS